MAGWLLNYDAIAAGMATAAFSLVQGWPGGSSSLAMDASDRMRQQDGGRWILRNVGDSRRCIIAHLVSTGTEGVWTSQLRQTIGYDDSKSMSDVFKAIVGRFRSVGLRPLWNGGPKDHEKGQKLSVNDNTVRLLFATLIKSDYPDLAKEFRIR